MRAVVQRVTRASVTVDGELLGRIGKGFMILLGVADGDTVQMAEKMADKICRLRIFEDENGKMNRGLQDIGGSILSISQFTLYADCKRGRRPGFEKAARGDFAQPMYHAFNEELRTYGIHVETGIFGADMKVDLLNDGPVTILLDSEEW